MIVMSRYTANGAFPEMAARLQASCERFGLAYDIRPTDDLGSWEKMCNAKPRWILGALLDTRQGVLWLDADCEIVSTPGMLFHCAQDFAIYNFAADAENNCNIAYDPAKLVSSSGVTLFQYTAAAIELLIRWISHVNQTSNAHGPDAVLDRAFNTCKPPVHPLWLPKAYNRLDSVWPEVKPVINHVYRKGKIREGAC